LSDRGDAKKKKHNRLSSILLFLLPPKNWIENCLMPETGGIEPVRIGPAILFCLY